MPGGTIDIRGSASWEGESVAQLEAEIEAGTRAALDVAGREMVALAVAMAPKETLHLASNIEAEVMGAEAVELGMRGSEAYFEAQEEGGDPHEIGEPGQNLYNREEAFEATGPVHHPGNPARHFLQNSWRMVGSRFTAIWARFLP